MSERYNYQCSSDLKPERRNELAGEWADRHRDLVRWGDAEITYAKPLHDVWAVPRREINNSSRIIKQNQEW